MAVPPKGQRSDGTEPSDGKPTDVSTGVVGSRRVRILIFGAIFLAAVAGGLFFRNQLVRATALLVPDPNSGREVLYWTSEHDASYRSDKPGKDGMGMDLVPVYEGQEMPAGPTVIDPAITERVYPTGLVEKGPLVRTLHTVSTIDYAEPRVGDITLKIDAWLEKLYVDHEGQPVRRGDPLFDVYSPELVSTQEEFLISLRAWQEAKQQDNRTILETTESNLNAAGQRLRFWDVTDEQIEELVKTGTVRKTLTFYSPFDGIVTEKQAFEGKFIRAGELLYRVADLSKVWGYVYAYQDQLHCVYEGQGATLRLPNIPGNTLQGKVVYIYPYLEPETRAVKVRLEFDNPDLLLKPGMFADVELEPHRMGVGIKAPKRAILQTGEREVVFVVLPGNKFQEREVTTGMELDGQMIEVLAGAREGERIVTEPSFLLDSESRLRAISLRFGPAPAWSRQMGKGEHEGHQMPQGAMPGMKHDAPPQKEMQMDQRNQHSGHSQGAPSDPQQ